MTECERIIKKGIISEDFLKPETNCEFYVEEKRKKIWAVLLDLLYELDRVCKKYNLKYYGCAGTLLGAVRHKGFIPWDDDLDVYLSREDYNELLKHIDEFKEPYFFQTPYTDPGYFYSFARLRNSNTTCVSEYFIFEDWNMGIFLDVFPIDEFVYDEIQKYYEMNDYLASENSTYMRISNPYLDDANKERVKNYSGRNPYETYEEIHKNAQVFAGDPRCDCVLEMVCTVCKDGRKKIIKKDEIKEVVYLDFEGFKLPTFNGYISYLERAFGDYMQFPPVEERGVWHSGITFDADVPYKTTVMLKRKKAEEENISD